MYSMQLAKADASPPTVKLGGGAGEYTAENMRRVYEKLRILVSSNAVVVFTVSGCCMCHVVKQLLFGLGVGPAVVELDRDSTGCDIQALLLSLAGGYARLQPIPVVFVGGNFLGGIEAVMACHITAHLFLSSRRPELFGFEPFMPAPRSGLEIAGQLRTD